MPFGTDSNGKPLAGFTADELQGKAPSGLTEGVAPGLVGGVARDPIVQLLLNQFLDKSTVH